MENELLLDSLNEAQREAVCAPVGNVLVLAGAGSGKTRVLVYRIAWLLHVMQYSPFNILAVTFTNKAANEMRGRIESLLHINAQSMWVGTFHGLSHRLLRRHWREANLSESFQILDSDDQYRLIKRIILAMELDEKRWAPKQIQAYINGKKDDGIRAAQIRDHGDIYTQTLARIYQQYEENCERNQVVDFAELMLRSFELLRDSPELLSHYQSRFRYVLVDEFQDTNAIQYAWIRLLTGQSPLMVVGDDDQSIYGWRGAKVENMQKLKKDYKDLHVIRLEQNYRSTGNILKASNALIENNPDRMGKSLWTEGGEGERISLYAAFNETDEARFIVDRIRDAFQRGQAYQDCAILYRSNAQSRVMEEALIQAGIPYRIYGGLRFFERAEIKDALGYLRLIANRNDDTAFERVINMPTRGVGGQTLSILRQAARAGGASLWQTAINMQLGDQLSARAKNAIVQFIQLVDAMDEETKNVSLSELVEHVLHGSGLLDHYRQEKGEKGQNRIENLQELISATKEFQDDHVDADITPLSAFLANAALEAGETQSDSGTDFVQMMTLHSAKGLEFPIVFLAGVEEGLFPHQLSISDPDRLAEERRLCYVGMTRAMKKLTISYAESRRIHGSENFHRPSRFIKELPQALLEEVRLRTEIARPVYSKKSAPAVRQFTAPSQNETNGLRLGMRVKHPTFGEGVVLSCEGNGQHARIQVKFNRVGAKWLVASIAKLEPVG